MAVTTISRTTRKALLLLALAAALMLSACGSWQGSANYTITDSDEALHNWHQARYYQGQGRYTLAREHFLLALAAARTENVRGALSQELQTVDLQIKTLR